MTWKDIFGQPERHFHHFPKMLEMFASYLFLYQINFELARD